MSSMSCERIVGRPGRRFLVVTALLLPAWAVATPAAALIVDLDAHVHAIGGGVENPLVVDLDAGTWAVTPIGPPDGAFQAFSPWAANTGDCLTGDTCTSGNGRGFFHRYAIRLGPGKALVSSPETWDGLIYADPADALANAVSGISFTLATPENVEFWLPTGQPLSDNRGGISLQLTLTQDGGISVSEPAMLALLGTGISGLLGSQRRSRRSRRNRVASDR
jgi:hypothetical protein